MFASLFMDGDKGKKEAEVRDILLKCIKNIEMA